VEILTYSFSFTEVKYLPRGTNEDVSNLHGKYKKVNP
jgi:hypothetical protein